MSPTLTDVSVGLLVLGVVFCALERVFPARKAQRVLRREVKLDLVYWFFTPLVTGTLARGVAIAAIVATALILGWEVGPDIAKGFGPIAAQPTPAIAVEMLLLGDLIGYWVHRWFHTGRLWKFHAVHHSSPQLDWLSSVRVHPLNVVVNRSIPPVVLVCLGFPLTALAAYVPFLTFYALFQHANTRVSLGPLRYAIASPDFHHWHHTSEEEGRDKNFAGLFSFYDLLFGTFYMPAGRRARVFGVADPVPATFLGQMAYPLRRSRAL